MMSGIRQRVTGSAIKNFLIWGIGFAVLWWFPIILLHYWPGMLVPSKEPWLLDLSDLTWQRIVVNLASKPGFRVVWVGIWTLLWMTMISLPTQVRQKRSLKLWKKRISGVSFRSSMEWVMDGKRASALKEYALLVGVI